MNGLIEKLAYCRNHPQTVVLNGKGRRVERMKPGPQRSLEEVFKMMEELKKLREGFSGPRPPKKTMPKKIVLKQGDKYARLTVIKECGRSGDGKVLWKCRCDCGKTAVVSGKSIHSGRTRSCGCLMRDTSALTHKTHGMSQTPEYKSWQSMIQRCEYPSQKCYKHYGGRGIKVHESWRHSFENFLRDVGPKPSPKHELERLNNNKGYEPGNVVWATRYEQLRNNRRNRLVTIDGITKPITDWANKLKMNISTVYTRMSKGWSEVDALRKPLLKPGHRGSRKRRTSHG
jgi:hypothetical protein